MCYLHPDVVCSSLSWLLCVKLCRWLLDEESLITPKLTCLALSSGYGHSVPLSDEGKAFCIFYSLFGIPVTLFFLSAVVQRLVVLVTQRPVSYFHHRWAMSKSKLGVIHAACLALTMTLLFLIIPAWIFITLEKDWNFLESVYFCFISLTTIGLGDYVPGQTHSKEDNPHPQLYRLAITGEYLCPKTKTVISFWQLDR